MGLDKIISFLLPRYANLRRKFNVKKKIKKKFKYIKDSKKLYVLLITPTKTKRGTLLKKRILKSGCSCLRYEIPEEILSSDYKSTLRDFKIIETMVKSELNQLKKRYGFSKINIIGVSLTCVNALMISNNNSLVNNIILIVPGHCLAESMWKSVRTQEIKEEFKKKGINLKKLKRYWKDLAPENNINKLRGKKIYIYLSKADEVIPYYCGRKLIKAMKKKKLKPKIIENSFLGHFGTIFLLSTKIDEILDDL